MKLLKTIKSNIDSTTKYVFSSNNNILEFSHIDKNDGKDIVVVPTQTSCNLKCKFCFLSELNIPARNLSSDEIFAGISYIVFQKRNNPTLLVSYMGCGEPLFNIDNVVDSMVRINDCFNDFETTRFAIASLVPYMSLLTHLIDRVKKDKLKCKFHYSLHSPFEETRKQLMPAAAPANYIFPILSKNLDSNLKAEIHYSLIDSINDSQDDALQLSEISKKYNLPIKLLKLAEKSNIDIKKSSHQLTFLSILKENGVNVEYYEPPGSDIGSSCGQFLLDYYK